MGKKRVTGYLEKSASTEEKAKLGEADTRLAPSRKGLAPGKKSASGKGAGGVGGIRTHEPAQHRLRDFQSRSFDHSDTTPLFNDYSQSLCFRGLGLRVRAIH